MNLSRELRGLREWDAFNDLDATHSRNPRNSRLRFLCRSSCAAKVTLAIWQRSCKLNSLECCVRKRTYRVNRHFENWNRANVLVPFHQHLFIITTPHAFALRIANQTHAL